MALTNAQKNKIRSKVKQRMFEMSQEIEKKMSDRYINLIKQFYFEPVFDNNPKYDPKYYWRHYGYNTSRNGILKSGLGRTFSTYERYYSGSNQRYVVGIRINDDKMYNDYTIWSSRYSQSDIHDFILNSAIGIGDLSWHGLPGSIQSEYNIYAEMLRCKEEIIKEYSK